MKKKIKKQIREEIVDDQEYEAIEVQFNKNSKASLDDDSDIEDVEEPASYTKGHTTITDKIIYQRKLSFFGGEEVKTIPLAEVDSYHFVRESRAWSLLLGGLFVSTGILLLLKDVAFGIMPLMVGLFLLIIGFLWRKEVLLIKSVREVIREDSGNLKELCTQLNSRMK